MITRTQHIVRSSHRPSLAIVMITLNEAHNIEAVMENINGFADEVYIVDSFSSDDTVSIAEEHGAMVFQREFKGFGDQWNFAVQELPIQSEWTMKLDPDERLSEELKRNIESELMVGSSKGIEINRRLWFMGKPMPVEQKVVRIWQTGTCQFTDVLVNEHPIVRGAISHVHGILEHHDSPSLEHWFAKQNKYTTSEAQTTFEGLNLAAEPKLFGTNLERRMLVKRVFRFVPFRHFIMFMYCWAWLGAWRSGRTGFIWAKLRATVYQMREYKLYEMQQNNGRLGTGNTS